LEGRKFLAEQVRRIVPRLRKINAQNIAKVLYV
jgi:hypothetical protein